jgi:hypothetical protein
MDIQIEWLSDDYHCETCGPSYAEGAIVTISDNGVLVHTIDMSPSAHCYDSIHYENDAVYNAILNYLGHTVVEV